jgi:hypothetical protein
MRYFWSRSFPGERVPRRRKKRSRVCFMMGVPQNRVMKSKGTVLDASLVAFILARTSGTPG